MGYSRWWEPFKSACVVEFNKSSCLGKVDGCQDGEYS